MNPTLKCIFGGVQIACAVIIFLIFMFGGIPASVVFNVNGMKAPAWVFIFSALVFLTTGVLSLVWALKSNISNIAMVALIFNGITIIFVIITLVNSCLGIWVVSQYSHHPYYPIFVAMRPGLVTLLFISFVMMGDTIGSLVIIARERNN